MARARTYKETADLFQILAHSGRLRILDELRRGQACVCHLQTVLDRPQAYVSQQLRVLREAEIVVGERDGLNVYYRIAHAHVPELLERMLGPGTDPTRLPNCPCPYCQAAAAGLKTPESTAATQVGLV
jgi:DNA-binding transcriptional ArsR family regulator